MSARLFEWPIGSGCWRSFGRAGRRFQCSFCLLATPGIFYKPVSRVRHRTIGILHCRGLLYRSFRKEHVRESLLVWNRWAGVGSAFRPAPPHGAVQRSPARKIDTSSRPVIFQAQPCTQVPSSSRAHEVTPKPRQRAWALVGPNCDCYKIG